MGALLFQHHTGLDLPGPGLAQQVDHAAEGPAAVIDIVDDEHGSILYIARQGPMDVYGSAALSRAVVAGDLEIEGLKAVIIQAGQEVLGKMLGPFQQHEHQDGIGCVISGPQFSGDTPDCLVDRLRAHHDFRQVFAFIIRLA